MDKRRTENGPFLSEEWKATYTKVSARIRFSSYVHRSPIQHDSPIHPLARRVPRNPILQSVEILSSLALSASSNSFDIINQMFIHQLTGGSLTADILGFCRSLLACILPFNNCDKRLRIQRALICKSLYRFLQSANAEW